MTVVNGHLRMTGENKTVFYGICGDGYGHFSRAVFLIPHLLKLGCSVEIFTSGRTADLCEGYFPECVVHRIPGLRMKYRDNRLDIPGTFVRYILTGITWLFTSSDMFKRIRLLRPVAVISDYEPVTAWIGSMKKVPVIAFDHQQIATECDVNVSAAGWLPRELLRMSNRMTYRRPERRIITSFFSEEFRVCSDANSKRHLISPVLRPSLMGIRPEERGHILVYQTSRTFTELKDILRYLPGEKRVYGTGAEKSGERECRFDEGQFLRDLASCRFAIVNGGHMTISESLFFGKPVVCFPVRGQAEQEINAGYVSRLGYGVHCKGNRFDFREFESRESEIRKNINQGVAGVNGNDELLRIFRDILP